MYATLQDLIVFLFELVPLFSLPLLPSRAGDILYFLPSLPSAWCARGLIHPSPEQRSLSLTVPVPRNQAWVWGPSLFLCRTDGETVISLLRSLLSCSPGGWGRSRRGWRTNATANTGLLLSVWVQSRCLSEPPSPPPPHTLCPSTPVVLCASLTCLHGVVSLLCPSFCSTTELVPRCPSHCCA